MKNDEIVVLSNDIEIINGVEVDWRKYKGITSGRNLIRARKSYVELCELLHKNGHTLESDYIKNCEKVLIDFNCGHEPHWIRPSGYKAGFRCPKCATEYTSRVAREKSKELLKNHINHNGHKLLSDYIGDKEKVLIDFNCGHKPHWIVSNSYKRGHGCPKCAGKCSEHSEEILVKLIEERGHKLLSKYTKNNEKVLIDFNCGHKPHWVIPANYKRGANCPKCAGLCPEKAEQNLIKIIEEKNHKLLSGYVNSKTKVLIDFNCGHEPHWITPSDYKNGYGCPKCGIEKLSGKNNRRWKGGISNISEYLRHHINEWKYDTLKQHNFKCIISNSNQNIVIHHLYNFSDILMELFVELDIEIRKQVKDYTDIELALLRKKCLELHYKYGLGVCLTEELHIEFHSIYGKEKNTIKQFEEFKKMKLQELEQVA